MNLIQQFPPQTKVKITKIECANDMKEKLLSMGVCENAQIDILHVSKKNSLVLIKTHNRRIALRCNLQLVVYAEKI